jgi:hypothetical protein
MLSLGYFWHPGAHGEWLHGFLKLGNVEDTTRSFWSGTAQQRLSTQSLAPAPPHSGNRALVR